MLAANRSNNRQSGRTYFKRGFAFGANGSRVLLAGVVVMVIAMTVACTKPKKTDGESDAQGSAGTESGTMAPTLAEKDITIDSQGSDSGNIAGLKTVFFDYDQARLSEVAKRDLAGNAEWIKNNPSVTMQIEGHTDSRGSTEYNLSLGERRAKSVRQYLEGLGVDSKRMNIISYGEEKPLAQGDGESAWGKNRRANFVPLR